MPSARLNPIFASQHSRHKIAVKYSSRLLELNSSLVLGRDISAEQVRNLNHMSLDYTSSNT
jgi:hypothetical protein